MNTASRHRWNWSTQFLLCLVIANFATRSTEGVCDPDWKYTSTSVMSCCQGQHVRITDAYFLNVTTSSLCDENCTSTAPDESDKSQCKLTSNGCQQKLDAADLSVVNATCDASLSHCDLSLVPQDQLSINNSVLVEYTCIGENDITTQDPVSSQPSADGSTSEPSTPTSTTSSTYDETTIDDEPDPTTPRSVTIVAVLVVLVVIVSVLVVIVILVRRRHRKELNGREKGGAEVGAREKRERPAQLTGNPTTSASGSNQPLLTLETEAWSVWTGRADESEYSHLQRGRRITVGGAQTQNAAYDHAEVSGRAKSTGDNTKVSFLDSARVLVPKRQDRKQAKCTSTKVANGHEDSQLESEMTHAVASPTGSDVKDEHTNGSLLGPSAEKANSDHDTTIEMVTLKGDNIDVRTVNPFRSSVPLDDEGDYAECSPTGDEYGQDEPPLAAEVNVSGSDSSDEYCHLQRGSRPTVEGTSGEHTNYDHLNVTEEQVSSKGNDVRASSAKSASVSRPLDDEGDYEEFCHTAVGTGQGETPKPASSESFQTGSDEDDDYCRLQLRGQPDVRHADYDRVRSEKDQADSAATNTAKTTSRRGDYVECSSTAPSTPSIHGEPEADANQTTEPGCDVEDEYSHLQLGNRASVKSQRAEAAGYDHVMVGPADNV